MDLLILIAALVAPVIMLYALVYLIGRRIYSVGQLLGETILFMLIICGLGILALAGYGLQDLWNRYVAPAESTSIEALVAVALMAYAIVAICFAYKVHDLGEAHAERADRARERAILAPRHNA